MPYSWNFYFNILIFREFIQFFRRNISICTAHYVDFLFKEKHIRSSLVVGNRWIGFNLKDPEDFMFHCLGQILLSLYDIGSYAQTVVSCTVHNWSLFVTNHAYSCIPSRLISYMHLYIHAGYLVAIAGISVIASLFKSHRLCRAVANSNPSFNFYSFNRNANVYIIVLKAQDIIK